MAERLINQLCKGRYNAVSAGSFSAGYVHPRSLEILSRNGIDVGEPRSKSWDEFSTHEFDLVITVCDQAANENCPAFLGENIKLHWSTPDPAAAKGTEREIDAAFEATYALLKNRVETELA